MRWNVIVVFVTLAAPVTAGPPVVYRTARLWPGDGPVIANAVLIVQDGKVVAVGKRSDVIIPSDAVLHDLGDAVIIPGLVVAETTLGERGRDDLHALTPHYRAADSFDPFADFSRALAGGVTTVQVSPGGRRLVPGQGSVVKLAGDNPARRTLREEESLRVVLGDDSRSPPRIYEPRVGAVSVDRPLEPTRSQAGGGLSSELAVLRAAFQAARAVAADGDPFLKAMAAAGTRGKPVRVFTPKSEDVQSALTLAREFDLRLLLVNPPVPSAEQLTTWRAHVDGVILDSGLRPGAAADIPLPDPDKRQRTDRATAARDLRAAGIRVAVKPVADADLDDMLYLGGLFTTHGTSAEALRMLTADAAVVLGVADRVGTLASGKDADFVVLSGDPFGLHTRVRTVYVDGQPVHKAAPAAKVKVIRGSRVLSGAGEVVLNGAVLVEGRTIRAIGRDVSAPADAEDKRFAGAVIVPGYIDLGSGLGFGGPLTAAVPLNTRLGARLTPHDPAAAVARQGGVTTVLTSGPAPSPVLAIKLGPSLRAVKDPVALKFAVRGNLTTAGSQLRETLRTGKAYADGWTKYDADLAEYERKKKEFDSAKPKAEEKKDDKKPEEKKLEEPKAPTKPQVSDALEPYRSMFTGKIPALVEARREDAVRLAVAVCRDEFNLRTALVGADDAWRVAELLAEKSVMVIIGPELVRTVERADVNLPLSVSLRGVPFGFQSQATTGSRHLPMAVGYAIRHGLGADDALRGLTAGPAAFLGLESVGTLAAGRDADLVVLSGMPFELSTRLLAVMVDGEWVHTD